MVPTVFAVCARLASGSTVDLLLFSDADSATSYVRALGRLPLGFDAITIVSRAVLGPLDEERLMGLLDVG